MNKTELKKAVDGYTPSYQKDPEATKEAILLDHEEKDANSIIAELSKLDEKKPDVKSGSPAIPKAQENHKHYKWYDEFQVRIQKREVNNVIAGRRDTVITGWELQKQLHPKFIEPHIAKDLNAFANGFDSNGLGNMLVPRDTMKTGDVIKYADWAKEQGIDPEQDLNILLTQKFA